MGGRSKRSLVIVEAPLLALCYTRVMDDTIPKRHVPERGAKGYYKKGQTGNPGGRPRKFYAMARYIREQLGNGQELADYAIEVFRNEDHTYKHSDRWAAMQWLADRGFGKPVATSIEISASEQNEDFGIGLKEVDQKTLDDLDEQVGVLMSRLIEASA